MASRWAAASPQSPQASGNAILWGALCTLEPRRGRSGDPVPERALGTSLWDTLVSKALGAGDLGTAEPGEQDLSCSKPRVSLDICVSSSAL